MQHNPLIPLSFTAPPSRLAANRPFAAFEREIDRLFDRLWRGLEPSAEPESAMTWLPQTDVIARDDAFEVEIELPGLEEKDLDVTLEGDHLVVRGERRDERESDGNGRGWLLRERRWGRFERMIPLTGDIDRDRIEAVYKNGVLRLTLPKTEAAKREIRRIALAAA